MGGQTALNCGIKLNELGALENIKIWVDKDGSNPTDDLKIILNLDYHFYCML